MMVMQFKVGDLVRAQLAMGKGVDGRVEPGDLGLVEELYHKGTLPDSDPFQLYRINWLPKAATGVWWMRGAHLSPLDGMDNAV
jgi:hypothetical protein